MTAQTLSHWSFPSLPRIRWSLGLHAKSLECIVCVCVFPVCIELSYCMFWLGCVIFCPSCVAIKCTKVKGYAPTWLLCPGKNVNQSSPEDDVGGPLKEVLFFSLQRGNMKPDAFILLHSQMVPLCHLVRLCADLFIPFSLGLPFMYSYFHTTWQLSCELRWLCAGVDLRLHSRFLQSLGLLQGA